MTIRRYFSILNSIVCHQHVLPILLACSITAVSAAQDTVDLDVHYEKGQQYRVQSQVEHAGNVIIDYAGKDFKKQELPIDVKARLDYHERFVGSGDKPQTVRFYDRSLAHIQLDKAQTDSELNEENRLIVSRINSVDGNTYQIASVNDMLEQRELELLKNPADPLSFAGLLDQKGVKVNAEWEPTRDQLARFLFVDHIIQSDVKLKLKEFNAEHAKVYLMGRLKAEVDDTITEMTVTGVLQIDLKEKHVSALRLNVIEVRKAAQIAPGFDGKTKVDLKITKSEGVPELSNESLKTIAQSRSIRNLLKWESYTGTFKLEYDPAWKVIASEEEAAILRYVENGDLLAQCNLVRLPSRPADKPLSLKEFETEVAKIVSKDPTSRVVDADQSSTINGLKALRVTVHGVEEEVPLNWVYYNVAAADGRQVTFVFTLEEEIAGRVAPAAKKMVDGFAFNSKPAAKLKFDLQNKKPVSRGAKADAADRR